jgi:HEAT repeat protein
MPITQKTTEDIAARMRMGKAAMSLIKSILQTSAYSVDHPLAQRGIEALFEELRELFEQAFELTFMVASHETKDDILMEGYLAEPAYLGDLLKSVMGDHFLKKFQDYFEWNKLVSFSLKRGLGLDDFRKFLSSMADRHREPPVQGTHRKNFSDELQANRIVNITAVCKDEIIGGERGVPWRVRVALSRLRKDLKVVPFYSHSTRRDLQEAKRLLIHDIMRPLRAHDLIVELLVNCDLVVEGIAELRDMDMESEIIGLYEPARLPPIAWNLVEQIEARQAVKLQDPVRSQSMDKLLRKLFAPLAADLSPPVVELFEHLFKHGIAELSELPAPIQEKLRIERLANTFLESAPLYIQVLREPQDATTFARCVSGILSILTDLVNRKQYTWIWPIAEALGKQARVTGEGAAAIAPLAAEALSTMASPGVLGIMRAHLAAGGRDQRHNILTTMAALGEPGFGVLIDSLKDPPDGVFASDVVQALTAAGPKPLRKVVEAIASKATPHPQLRFLVQYLGGVRDYRTPDAVRTLLGHPAPEVRAEVLDALFRLLGPGATDELLAGLGDPHAGVRKRAILKLGELQCADPALLATIQEAFGKPSKAEAAEAVDLKIAMCHVLSQLATASREAVEPIEPSLIEALKYELGFHPLERRGKDPRRIDAFKAALADAMGAIGTGRSESVLKKLQKDASPALRRKGQEAWAAIAGRHHLARQPAPR